MWNTRFCLRPLRVWRSLGYGEIYSPSGVGAVIPSVDVLSGDSEERHLASGKHYILWWDRSVVLVNRELVVGDRVQPEHLMRIRVEVVGAEVQVDGRIG